MLNEATPKLAERLAKRLSEAVHDGELGAGTRPVSYTHLTLPTKA